MSGRTPIGQTDQREPLAMKEKGVGSQNQILSAS